jgi:hypothetical protein
MKFFDLGGWRSEMLRVRRAEFFLARPLSRDRIKKP